MHLTLPALFDVFAKALFIGGAVPVGGRLPVAHARRVARPPQSIRRARRFAIGVLVCMVLFWVLLIGGRFWGGGTATMGSCHAGAVHGRAHLLAPQRRGLSAGVRRYRQLATLISAAPRPQADVTDKAPVDPRAGSPRVP